MTIHLIAVEMFQFGPTHRQTDSYTIGSIQDLKDLAIDPTPFASVAKYEMQGLFKDAAPD